MSCPMQRSMWILPPSQWFSTHLPALVGIPEASFSNAFCSNHIVLKIRWNKVIQSGLNLGENQVGSYSKLFHSGTVTSNWPSVRRRRGENSRVSTWSTLNRDTVKEAKLTGLWCLYWFDKASGWSCLNVVYSSPLVTVEWEVHSRLPALPSH